MVRSSNAARVVFFMGGEGNAARWRIYAPILRRWDALDSPPTADRGPTWNGRPLRIAARLLRALGVCRAPLPDRLDARALVRVRHLGARRRRGARGLYGWARPRIGSRCAIRPAHAAAG